MVSAPWPAEFQVDVTVDVQITEMIGAAGDNVRLTADWTIHGPHGAAAAYRRSFAEPLPGSGYDDLAAAHSRVLGTFCRAIADTLGAAAVN